MLRISLIILLFCQIQSIGFAQGEPNQFNYSSLAESEKSEAELIQLLEANRDTFEPNFNLASFYYNKAVGAIENLNYESASVSAEQQEIETILQKAVGPALIAFRRDQKHPELLVMLSGIYFGLGDMRMSDYYKSLQNK